MYGELIAYWTIFGLTHSLLAAERVKAVFSSFMGAHFQYYRLYYSIFSFLLLCWILWFQYSHPDQTLFRLPAYVSVAAALLLLPAMIIMSICIRKYFYHLSGIDALFPEKESSAKLETGGLNRFVRHPLYSGTLLLVWCLFLLFPTAGNLISAGMITLYTIIGTLFEEKKLRRSFGEAYILYQQQVPMLIPFLKRNKNNADQGRLL
ncbi:methyltransferase family protein [Pseudoflavitalea rhizosphaerae]|uniref:methyltransferase family protein n=1 Tax=Pseudoflavitalea rhizosphaerae TaxID=1884793 RepID=UPI000F8C5B61|nr:NnrU family protein [Pseudoflavitalea rhizosphaerae]